MVHPACLPPDELLNVCHVATTRRSGPGGQHRNKVETAVVVVHLPSGVRGEASERRSQLQNREVAIQRLRVKLALAVRHEASTVPSQIWQARAAGGKLTVSVDHAHYPALLAEALDVVHANDYDISAAAAQLGISASQLVKLLRTEPMALAQVNVLRRARGLSSLS